jgi:hypothetical protein
MRLFIEVLSPSPITGADQPDAISSDGETDGEHPAVDHSEGEVPRLGKAVFGVLGEDEARIVHSNCTC